MTLAQLAFVVVGTLFMGLWGAAIVLAVQAVMPYVPNRAGGGRIARRRITRAGR